MTESVDNLHIVPVGNFLSVDNVVSVDNFPSVDNFIFDNSLCVEALCLCVTVLCVSVGFPDTTSGHGAWTTRAASYQTPQA